MSPVNKNNLIPPPFGEDMEEAWRAQYKALQEGRVRVSPWWKPFAAGGLITISVLAVLLFLYFCGVL